MNKLHEHVTKLRNEAAKERDRLRGHAPHRPEAMLEHALRIKVQEERVAAFNEVLSAIEILEGA